MTHDILIEERYFSKDVESLMKYSEEFQNAYMNGEELEMAIQLSVLFELCPRKAQKKQMYERFVAFLGEKGIVLRILSRKQDKPDSSASMRGGLSRNEEFSEMKKPLTVGESDKTCQVSEE